MNITKWGTYLVISSLILSNLLSIVVYAQGTGEGDLLNLLEQLEESDGAAEGTDEAAPEEAPAEEAAPEHDAAEDILNDLEDDKWDPSSIDEIEVEEIGADSATFIITEISYDGTPIENYKIYYSNETLATVQNYDDIADAVVDVEPDMEGTDDDLEEGQVRIKLENLTPETTYYVLVAPVHPSDETADPISMISDEVTFTTDKDAVSADTKIFDNVSYTYADSDVTVTWDPSDLAEKTEVHIRHQSEGSYTKVGDPDMADGSISFKVDKTGNYFLKLVALDGEGNPVGKEHIQTIKIDEVEEAAPEITTAPQVGPTANALIGLMVFSFIVYLVYRFRKIER